MIDELKTRISSLGHMSPDDWRQVLNELTDKARETKETQPSLLSALSVRITYDLVNALHRMDRTSAELARKLVVLTWILVVFTGILLVEPAVEFYQWIHGNISEPWKNNVAEIHALRGDLKQLNEIVHRDSQDINTRVTSIDAQLSTINAKVDRAVTLASGKRK